MAAGTAAGGWRIIRTLGTQNGKLQRCKVSLPKRARLYHSTASVTVSPFNYARDFTSSWALARPNGSAGEMDRGGTDIWAWILTLTATVDRIYSRRAVAAL